MGIERRLAAGAESLADRAALAVTAGPPGPVEAASEYGDTDQVIPVRVGDVDAFDVADNLVESIAVPHSRHAVLAADLILHRTVGNRVVWSLRLSRLLVAATATREVSEFLPEEIRQAYDDSLPEGDIRRRWRATRVIDGDFEPGPPTGEWFYRPDHPVEAWIATICSRVVAELAAQYVAQLAPGPA